MTQPKEQSEPHEPVSLSIQDSVAFVTLQQPPLNIYDLAMRDALIEVLRAVSDITELKAMVLQTSGANFCAGADLAEFGSASSILEGRRIRWDRDPWGLMLSLTIPTIAALTGVTLGSGLEMALLCDFRIADHSAVLGLPETKLAMLPAAGGSQSLTALVGPSVAFPIIGTAETLSPTKAWQCGILTAPPTESLDDEIACLVAELARVEPKVMAAAKRALAGARDLPLDQGLTLEKQLASTLLGD